jgi:DNA-binding transcriptional regulator LsrR (DeoR family)
MLFFSREPLVCEPEDEEIIMPSFLNDIESERLINRILTLYYLEDKSQQEIGEMIGFSAVKVNRLLKQARAAKWVDFVIRTPSQTLFDLERAVQKTTGVKNAIVVPRFTDNPEALSSAIGLAAANYFLKQLRDGDVVCVGGGRGVAAMVQAVETENHHPVQVVPALGGVQGRFDTDVNNLAGELAKRLGGVYRQLYAPAFMDSEAEQLALNNLRHVKEVMDAARKAQIAVVGVGAIDPLHSSILQFTSLSPADLERIVVEDGGCGEILARVYDPTGKPCAQGFTNRVMGLTLEELRGIPLSIGVVVSDNKARAVVGALKGNYLKTIVMDEGIAREVLTYFNP